MSLESWPEWACDEDGEMWWIRGDLAARNDLALLPDLGAMDICAPGAPGDPIGIWSSLLVFDGKVACWLNLASDPDIAEWRLHELHDDDPADEAVVYWTYTATTVDYLSPGDVVFGATA